MAKKLKIKDSGRKALLFMDNASVHSAATVELRDKLANTEIRFFPKNSTSKIQPLDAGIIQALKLSYRTKLHTRIMHRLKDDMEADPNEGLEYCACDMLDCAVLEQDEFTHHFSLFCKMWILAIKMTLNVTLIILSLWIKTRSILTEKDDTVFPPFEEPEVFMQQAIKEASKQENTCGEDVVSETKEKDRM